MGYGAIPYVKWYKREVENILGVRGMHVEKPAEDELEALLGLREARVPPEVHAGIVESYALGMGMKAVALKYGLSSAAVKSPIERHNSAVANEGRCRTCTAEKSGLAEEVVDVRRR